MQKIDYLEVQSKLAKTMRQVCKEESAVTINGAGKDQVVMMPLDTFEQLIELQLTELQLGRFQLSMSTELDKEFCANKVLR
jgi:PHD/YefM family antitoxin component YafN of YafNO toxin-antitoxin module